MPIAYLSTADLSTYLLIMQYLSTTDLSSYSFVSARWLTVYCWPFHLSCNQYAVFVYRRPVHHLPFFLFFCICKLPTCLPPTCQPKSTDYSRPVYLSSYFFVSANCLPVHRRTVHLCSLTTWLPPTCLPSICLPILLHQPTAYLSTADLPIYVHWLPDYGLHVFLFLCICQLPTCPPVHLSYNQYAAFVYRQPFFLFLCICQLPTCLTPICEPMSTDYRRPVYRLPVFLFLCFCQLPTCLPPTLSTYVHWLPPTCLPSTSLFIDYRRPVYRLPVFLFLCICQLPTCLPLTCQPMSTDYLSTADLSTAYLYFCYLLYAESRPVYRLPVFLFLSICQLPTCLPPTCPPMSLTTCLLPTCLPPTCPEISTEWSTADKSTADLSTYVYLYAVSSRTLIYCALIQENCIGTNSTNTSSNLR